MPIPKDGLQPNNSQKTQKDARRLEKKNRKPDSSEKPDPMRRRASSAPVGVHIPRQVTNNSRAKKECLTSSCGKSKHRSDNQKNSEQQSSSNNFCFSANEVLPIAMPIPVESLNGDPPHRGQDERDGGSPDSAISASPADGGERINRLVEKLEEIANQYERDCQQEFQRLASYLDSNFENRGVAMDFEAFRRMMDQILENPSIRASLETPNRRVVFVRLLNYFYTQQLGTAGQFVSRLWGFAIEYINTLSPFAMLSERTSSSAFGLSTSCNNDEGDDEQSRSRLSSVGAQSSVSSEPNDNRYSSTFELDLTAGPLRNSSEAVPVPVGCSSEATCSIETPTNFPKRKFGWTTSSSFSSSVDKEEYDDESREENNESRFESANDIIQRSLTSNSSTELSRSAGIVRKRTKERRPMSEDEPSSSSASNQHQAVGRRESDVDSAFGEESLPSASLPKHSAVIPNHPDPTSANRRTRNESASVTSVEDLKREEEAILARAQAQMQARGRRRQAGFLGGLGGRLLSFSEILPQTESRPYRSFSISTASHSRFFEERNADRTQGSEGSYNGFYTTFTLCILAAIFISKK
ncbi:uncharacterized protein LOC134846227 isoform X3 [Symsagittifera roscoffensis]|uniref:uncharacterized protein LOC134846227 isoform X3 n=1 Tax=Symsagittifera roscoffensis TaxID=84072 RepID=UPI00307C091B